MTKDKIISTAQKTLNTLMLKHGEALQDLNTVFSKKSESIMSDMVNQLVEQLPAEKPEDAQQETK